MIPLVDIHCHLLAGLDDGPRTDEEALAMCRMAYAEGTRVAAATAHQNERWKDVSPDRIRTATQRLAELLKRAEIPLSVHPTAEVTARPDLGDAWEKHALLSVADRGQYMLLEMPHGLFVDLRPTIAALAKARIRPILAHPERQPELLHEPGELEQLIAAGCLVQVSSHSVTRPASRNDERALRDWFRRGIVHVMGSDGHSTQRRPPAMADAYYRIRKWTDSKVADRVCSTNGFAILHGLPLCVRPPERPVARWLPRLW
jgi:protein-tyrosine phosphatase